MHTGLRVGLLALVAGLALAACSGGKAGTPTPGSLGGNSQVSGFTPTPTAAIRNVTPAPSTPTGQATAPSATGAAPTAPAAGALQIGVVGNDLKFDAGKLSAKAGSDIQVTLKNNATSKALQHNWVLVKQGTVDAVASAGLGAGPANNWIAKGDPNVLGFVPLVDGGASGTATIKVPAPGTYQFLCSFPGHSATMQGTLEATP